MSTSGTYGVAGAMLLVALAVAFAPMVLVRRLRAAAPMAPPEHGGATGAKSWVQFRVRYGILALIFVAFDMEMVFMFPWAVAFKAVGFTALLDLFVFVAILSSIMLFALKEGAFDWEG
jgi:NADH:ubiquinone oxidoreductase subunit 3 (subunit A)